MRAKQGYRGELTLEELLLEGLIGRQDVVALDALARWWLVRLGGLAALGRWNAVVALYQSKRAQS